MSDPNKVQSHNSPVGAVMVVGGGIAGMQAALDLADQGFRVYLVEAQSAIGGKMAQLDKTFPHQRLRHVYHLAPPGGGGPPSQHHPADR